METRASHLIVGSFVLVFLAFAVTFAIWIAKVDPDASYENYDIYFNGTVSGLYERGTVFYLGIPVGDVRDIGLAPDDPSKVKVHIRLKAEVPVTESTRATLEFQGLTGVAYIELQGGAAGEPPLQALAGADYPVIAAENSAFQELFARAPNLVDEAILTVVRIQRILSDENIAKIDKILANAEAASGNLDRGTQNLDAVLADLQVTLKQADKTMKSVNTVATNAGDMLEKDVKAILTEAKTTVTNVNQLLARVDEVVSATGQPVSDFLSGSLPEVSRMIMDLRITARSLARLVKNIEDDPSSVIFPAKPDVYNVETGKKEKKK